ncbi:MAG: hypothetical protein IPK07_18945 [Deltaproteobacteria bacterium]|nr:hypothetical protein [Deltaproteobacteria bacterium]
MNRLHSRLVRGSTAAMTIAAAATLASDALAARPDNVVGTLNESCSKPNPIRVRLIDATYAVEDGHTVAGKTGTTTLTYWCGDSEEQLTCPPDTNYVSIQGRTEENNAASSFITTCIIQDKKP